MKTKFKGKIYIRGGGGVGKGEAIHFYGGGIKALCVVRDSKQISICLSVHHRGLVYL